MSFIRLIYVLLHEEQRHKKMVKTIQTLFTFLCIFFLSLDVTAQTAKWQDLYKVKKKDTIYGISRKYNITIDELMDANPDMKAPGYSLKKGDQLLIPSPSKKTTTPSTTTAKQAVSTSTNVCVGVMLPLHNVDGDGQRMTEYYRGILMACDSLKKRGINTSVYAWNVPVDADVKKVLSDPNAAKCNIIFGPLYTKQVSAIGDFCHRNNIKLVIPFSINGNDVATNPMIYQVYQSESALTKSAINAFLDRLGSKHVVFVDCNDSTSHKGSFTFALRKKLEARGVKCNITNLRSSDAMFAKAFVQNEGNMVVLNTGRSPELNATLAKLDILKKKYPSVSISLYGYTEWLMYTKVYCDYFHKYDAYIPTPFYYNPSAKGTADFTSSYNKWFKSSMRESLPRFAIMGYDHALFFIGGMHRYGNSFSGNGQQQLVKPLQTPLKFKRLSGGGLQNHAFMLVHYKTDHTMESINY